MTTYNLVDPKEVWGQPARARLPAADDGAIAIELDGVLHEFVKNSLCLLAEKELVLEAGKADYPLNPFTVTTNPLEAEWAGAKALYTHRVEYAEDSRPLRLLDGRPSGVSSNYSGGPLVAYCPEPAVVQFYPTPTESEVGKVYRAWASLTLVRPVEWVPEILADYYYDGILDGISARMMTHAKRPYSDPKLAEYYMRRFRNAMRTAKDETMRRWSNAESSFRFNRDWSHQPQLRHSR